MFSYLRTLSKKLHLRLTTKKKKINYKDIYQQCSQREVKGSRSLYLGRFPGGGNGNLLQYYCLENPMDQRSLVAHSLWGWKELDITAHTYLHTHPHMHAHMRAHTHTQIQCRDNSCENEG